VNPEGYVDPSLFRLRPGRLPDVQGPAVFPSEGHRDLALIAKGLAEAVPAVGDALGVKTTADDLHKLVGKDRDQQMTVTPDLFVMIDGTKPQFRLEGAKDRFQVGEHDVGALQPLLVPARFVAPQAVDPRMGLHRTVGQPFLLQKTASDRIAQSNPISLAA